MSTLDTKLFFAVNQFAGQNHLLDQVFIFTAQYSPFLLAIYLLGQYFTGKRIIQTRKMIWLSLLAFIFAELIAKLVGRIYYHSQPFDRLPGVHRLIAHAVDNAFPSDHSILFFSIMMIFFLFKKGNYRWFYLLAAAVVGFSRVWVGVHSPIDILGGGIIGIASGFFVQWLNVQLKEISILTSKLSLYFLPKRSK